MQKEEEYNSLCVGCRLRDGAPYIIMLRKRFSVRTFAIPSPSNARNCGQALQNGGGAYNI